MVGNSKPCLAVAIASLCWVAAEDHISKSTEVLCPLSCYAEHCRRGVEWNGGTDLIEGVCQNTCSRKFFGKVRYCGASNRYLTGDSVNCTGCSLTSSRSSDVRSRTAETSKETDDIEERQTPPPKQSLREELLQEARKRLTAWYEDQASMNLPFMSFNAKIQQTKQWYWCDFPNGSMHVPVTFGEFNVTDASPLNVFNTLSDVQTQTAWDKTVDDVNLLGDFKEDGVRGVEMLMPSGILMVPPREVFQWMAFNGSLSDQEFWFVASTLKIERLHEVRHVNREAVQADNCLGAYWVRPCPAGGETHCPIGNPRNCCPEGGSRVIFTGHVNVHPPKVISEKSIFDLSWPKQIDWVNALRKRSAEVSRNATTYAEGKQSNDTVIPRWLWQDGEVPLEGTGVHLDFPHRIYDTAVVTGLYADGPGLRQRGAAAGYPASLTTWAVYGMLAVACSVFALAVAGRRRQLPEACCNGIFEPVPLVSPESPQLLRSSREILSC